MVSFDTKSYSKRLLHLISWSHWFTFFNMFAAILLSAVYLFSESLPTTSLGMFYLVLNWLSHMAFLTFIGFVLTVFPLTLLYPETRFIRTAASVIFALFLGALVLDGYTYSQLGYHLNASSSTQIVSLLADAVEVNANWFWSICVLVILSILAFELVVSNYAWKHMKDLQKTRFARYIAFGFVGAFFVSHLSLTRSCAVSVGHRFPLYGF